MKCLNRTTRRRAPGFTLIELLVVIAIIALLMGLLLVGVSALRQGAKESQAQAVLTNLMGNAGQYETKTDYAVIVSPGSTLIAWGVPRLKNAPGEQANMGTIQALYVNDENNGNVTYSNGKDNDFYMRQANRFIERFIWAANQLPAIRNNLPSLGGAFVDADGDGFMEVIDPWGNPIAYGNAVSHNDNFTDDDFLPVYSKSFFASAGQDQKWGLPKQRGEFSSDAAWEAYKGTDDHKFAVDNLYSFDLDRSESHR